MNHKFKILWIINSSDQAQLHFRNSIWKTKWHLQKYFLINQTFSRFSLCEKGWRKARESLICIKILADPSRSYIVFILVFGKFCLGLIPLASLLCREGVGLFKRSAFSRSYGMIIIKDLRCTVTRSLYGNYNI